MQTLEQIVGSAVLDQVRGSPETKAAQTAQPRVVVVRSSGSGVWLGYLGEQNDTTRKVVLLEARRAWQWVGAASCSGLALHGPSGGKICEPVARVEVFDVLEVIDATEAAIARWKAVPAWKA
jgi:hypothetical protein